VPERKQLHKWLAIYCLLTSVNLADRNNQARNSEKAQSMLFRFREAQAADLGIIDAGRTRRPKMITEVAAIPACEKWRGQVLKEISRKVSKIQDPSLSDFMIRDLNDEINKLMREKHMWEIQIRNLGGPNYMRGGGKVYDEEGREIPGSGKGYRYVVLSCHWAWLTCVQIFRSS
jgi:pre-mRNA-splicing factor ISY1